MLIEAENDNSQFIGLRIGNGNDVVYVIIFQILFFFCAIRRVHDEQYFVFGIIDFVSKADPRKREYRHDHDDKFKHHRYDSIAIAPILF